MKISKSFFVIAALITLVFISQVILLKPIIGQGLTNEDYVGFFKIRAYQDKFFTDPVGMWNAIGMHDVAHDFYMAFLDSFFSENYTMYLYTTIFFKIVATLLLFPLIYLISKNMILAFLTTFLYGISYPSAGALYLYVVGNEYIGVALMNLFLILYYFLVKKTNLLLLILTLIVITLSFLISPIRIFPVFVIVLLVEACILVKYKFLKISYSLIRLAFIFFPFLLILLLSLGNSGSGAYSLKGFPEFFKLISDGNWYLTLYPLWGLGYLFLPAAYLTIFSPIDVNDFASFFMSLFQKTMIIFAIFSILLSLRLASKRLRFFFILTGINFIFDTIVFFLYTHHFYIPKGLVQGYSGPAFSAGLYAGILAAFVISISLTCFIEWHLSGRKNRLLLLIFLGPFISLLFIGSQWIFTRQYYMYQEGIHRYFVIPAMGVSLFIAALFTSLFQKSALLARSFFLVIIVFFIFSILNISKNEIAQVFYGKKNSGKELELQKSFQNQVLSYISKDRLENDLIVYLRFNSGVPGGANQWEDTFDWRNLSFWLHNKRSYILKKPAFGCISMIWDIPELQKMAQLQNGTKGFSYKNGGGKEERCLQNGKGYSMDGKFINISDFYAFSIEGPKVVNISQEIEDSLVFK